MSRIMLASLTLLGLTLAAVHAQDDLGEIRARQKIALEKLTGDVRDAIAKAQKDPENARFTLSFMLRQVEGFQDLTEKERAPLVQQLKNRIRQLDETARGDKIRQDQKPLADPPQRVKPFTPPDQPGSKGSGSASSVAKGFSDSIKGAQKTYNDNTRAREAGMLASSRDIERMLPMDGDINFPKNWKEISERRKAMVNPKLTEAEVKLLKTLNSTLSVNYDKDNFKAVLNHLQDRTGLTIIVDEGSLRDNNVDYDDPVTFKVEKASVRTILKKVLGDKGLTYIIKEGAIQVMTPKRASEYTVTRSYPISDLITPVQANAMFPPFMQMMQKRQNAQQLINLIVSMTGQDYWQPNGPGSISYFEAGDSLLIRASAEMHYQLASPGLFGAR